jgi:hypothetical protein
MAKDDNKRKNFWDDEEEEQSGTSKSKAGASTSVPDSEALDRKINEARALMEQTHQLYQHYFNGIEKRVPIEKVKQLEAKISELNRTGTNVTSARFKLTQFLSQYSTMKEMWERKLRDMERK